MKKGLISLITTLILSACGGGGGSDSEANDGNNNKANTSPTISVISSISTDENQTVTIDAAASDSDGSISSISWSQTQGESLELAGQGTLSLTFTAPNVLLEEKFQFQVTVTDNDGASSSQTVDVTVSDIDGAIFLCPAAQDTGTADITCSKAHFSKYQVGSIENYTVTDSSLLLVDRNARKQELASYETSDVDSLCSWGYLDYDADLTSFSGMYNSELHYDLVFDWTNGISEASANYFAKQTPESEAYLKRNLLEWAESGAMTNINMQSGSDTYALKRFSMVTLLAWETFKSNATLTTGERETIETYLTSVFNQLDYKDYIEQGADMPSGLDAYNHGWFRDSALMLWGVMSDNDVFFQTGVKRYFRVLDAHVRNDGSIVQESQRGSHALHYQVTALTSMVMIAETAAQQGYDLYSVKVDGVDIHTIIDFTISAIADHDLIKQYAQHQVTCSPEQCANWEQQDFNMHWGWNDMAWIEVYVRRFPDSELTAKIREIYTLENYPALYYDIAGSVTTCDYRKL